MSGSDNKTEIKIRASRYAALVKAEESTGISIEELVDRALTDFIKSNEAKAS